MPAARGTPSAAVAGTTVLGLLRAEAGGELRRLVLAANVAGLANAMLLASINAAAGDPAHAGFGGLLLFLVVLVLYAAASRRVNLRINELMETALHRIKLRVGDAVVRAELDALERVGAAEICDRITENLTFASDRTGLIATLLQSGLIALFLSLYVAWLSPAVPAITTPFS